MSDVILHHYDLSPYSEKIRLIFGLKGLAWRSVEIPMVMPKPNLTCLTGGYRKTPVLQIGADIYCDTKAIARAIERIAPEPTLYPPGTDALEPAVSVFGDTLFMMGVVAMLGSGMFPQEFLEDRKKMIPGGFDVEQAKAMVPAKRDQIRTSLMMLDRQLEDGRPYLLGDAVSLADFSVYHTTWFFAAAPATADLLEPFGRLAAWRERIAAFGHGRREELSAEDAIAIARQSEPATREHVAPGEPNGYQVGDRLTVFPEDYGRDPVQGELVYADPYEIAIRRRDERAGEVVVHFPRLGFAVLRADT